MAAEQSAAGFALEPRDGPTPKRHRRLPTVLSPEEVRSLIAEAQNLFHRTMLMTLFGAGPRRSELCHLKVSHIGGRA